MRDKLYREREREEREKERDRGEIELEKKERKRNGREKYFVNCNTFWQRFRFQFYFSRKKIA